MSIDAILQQLPQMESSDLSRIRDLLNSIEDQRNTEHMQEMARRIDDKDPSHWLTLEEFDRRLAERNAQSDE